MSIIISFLPLNNILKTTNQRKRRDYKKL